MHLVEVRSVFVRIQMLLVAVVGAGEVRVVDSVMMHAAAGRVCQ